MKKGMLISLALVTALSITTLSARGGGHFNQNFSNDSGNFMPKGGHGAYGMLTLFSDVNLTSDQSLEIQKIMLEMRYAHQQEMLNDPKTTNLKSAISSSGFDKSLFIQNATTTFATHIESEATYLESIFSLLTSEQKQALYDSLNSSN